MVLGAGPFQASGIRKAAELGIHVITVDYLPENIGHRHGHEYVNLSTVDREGVLQAAKLLRVDGVCTFSSDVAVPTVAYVCESLGLPRISFSAAETLVNKHLFRSFLQDGGFPCPRFFSGSSWEDIYKNLNLLSLPIIFKPVDTSGSRGITRIDNMDLAYAREAFFVAQKFTRSGTVCVEEYVEGTEVGGDAILMDGKVVFAAITKKHLHGFVVTGHSLPTDLLPEDQHRIIQQIEAICVTLEYHDGLVNFDTMVSPKAITMLEMSARNGGNGIPSVIALATGVDTEQATILLALGEKALVSSKKPPQGAGSFVFGSQQAGILEHIASAETLKRHVPEVFDVHFAINQGHRVEPFEHNGNLIGYVVFGCQDADNYKHLTRKILDTLDIRILCE